MNFREVPMFCFKPIKKRAALFAAVFCCSCAAPGPTIVSKNASPASTSSAQGELRLKAPEGWLSERPSSSMRLSQYQLPSAEGDSEAASIVVYYFGAGQGGSVDANLERWIGQMQSSDGRPSKDKAKTDTTTVNGLKVTLLDVSGTYAGGDMGGGGAAQNKPDFRMRAAVIETPKGAYFIKLVGPRKTVDRWDQAFQEFVKSAEFK
jgi:hypothetical protein